MHSRIAIALAALLGAPARGASDEPSDASADRSSAEDETMPRDFLVELDPAESTIPQILRAGRPELVAACRPTRRVHPHL
jgi:hypothetical protein